MKNRFYHVCQVASLGLLLGLALPTAGAAASPNFVRNPSFEQPLAPDNWTVVYDNCDPCDFLIAGRSTMAHKDVVPGTWDADPPGSTNYLSRQGGHFAPNYCNGLMHGYFRQVLTNLRPGIQYTCSAWMVQYTRNDNYLDRSQVWMEVLGGPNRSVSRQTQYVLENANNNPAGWRQYTVTNTASQNGELELRLHYAFIRTIAQIWEYRNINAYYDDVEVPAVNQPPRADASATAPRVIAPGGTNAQVTLDGSRSTDPDGDPLHYFWYQAGVAAPLATGVVAVVRLPAGTNALELAVDDGLATNRQAFTVEVILNQPPQADASATAPLVLVNSPCSTTAQVVLDGSRSSDPDGNALSYFWYRAGATNVMATGMVAVVTLPVGLHALELAVSDGLATGRQAFTVEVITIGEALNRLRARVQAEAAKPQPLLAALNAAIASVERCNRTSAANQLHAFQNKVRAQVARDNPALAQQWTEAAQEIIDLLSGGKGRQQAQLTRVERLEHGKVRIKLAAESKVPYVVEASTNLVNWEPIGVASERADGTFEFTDPGAAGVKARFYRIRSLVPADTQ
jgi:hypothetical protein